MLINYIPNKKEMSDTNSQIVQYLLLLGYPLSIALTPIFVYFGINQEIFVILCCLLIFDGFLGGWKSHVLRNINPEKYTEWQWKKFWWGISEKLLMAIIPFIVAVLAITLSYDGKFLADISIKIMAVSEAYSVFGNMWAIRNKKDVKRLDAISILLQSMRGSLHLWLQSTLKKIEKSKDCDFRDREI
jgi:hypothetical protein